MSYIDIYRELKEDPDCLYKKVENPNPKPEHKKIEQPCLKQEGGSHYTKSSIQPVDYVYANKLNFFEGNVVKYVTRHKDKNGDEDIRKAIHYLEMILKYEYGQDVENVD
jgi:hypothetical protein